MQKNNNQEYVYDEHILASIQNLLQYYTKKHGKTLVIRVDVTYPLEYSEIASNKHLSECIAKVIKKYDRQGLDPKYLWVMEQNNSVHPHYHILILLNGNKVRAFSHVFDSTEQLWSSTIGADASGCIHYCLGSEHNESFYNGKLLVRAGESFADDYNSVLTQLSYLAKTYSKNYNQDGLRNFGMSRIPI